MNLTRLGDINYPYLQADSDISNDKVHTELLKDLNAAGQKAGVVLRITTAKSDHDQHVKGTDRTSRHMAQTAVDISKLDGINSWNEKGTATDSNLGNPAFRDKGNRVKDALVSMGYTWNREKGNPKAVLWLTNAGGNHYNHLHVSNDPTKTGWQPSKASDEPTGEKPVISSPNVKQTDIGSKVQDFFDERDDEEKDSILSALLSPLWTEGSEKKGQILENIERIKNLMK